MVDLTDEDVRTNLRRARLFRELIETEAWKELWAIGNAQIAAHLETLISAPSGELDGQSDVLQTYFRKGAIFGIKIILGTPSGTIALANDLSSHRTEKEHVDAQRHVNSDPEQPELFPDAVVTDLS